MEQARKLAEELSAKLTVAGVMNEVCGSIRRGTKETVGDLDVIVSDLHRAYMVLAPGEGLFEVPKPLTPAAKGRIRRSADVEFGGLTVNLYLAFQDEWGAMKVFLTGNGVFNVQMRGFAKGKGYKLNQYGLFHGEDKIAGRDEFHVFYALGLRWIEPNEREFQHRVDKIHDYREV
jgi:DNA polymerase (family 10)